jgi:hypothetical protein
MELIMPPNCWHLLRSSSFQVSCGCCCSHPFNSLPRGAASGGGGGRVLVSLSNHVLPLIQVFVHHRQSTNAELQL